MKNVDLKPASHRENDKWIPDGMVRFYGGSVLKEHRETYYEVKLDTKEEADQYFLRAGIRRYKIGTITS